MEAKQKQKVLSIAVTAVALVLLGGLIIWQVGGVFSSGGSGRVVIAAGADNAPAARNAAARMQPRSLPLASVPWKRAPESPDAATVAAPALPWNRVYAQASPGVAGRGAGTTLPATPAPDLAALPWSNRSAGAAGAIAISAAELPWQRDPAVAGEVVIDPAELPWRLFTGH